MHECMTRFLHAKMQFMRIHAFSLFFSLLTRSRSFVHLSSLKSFIISYPILLILKISPLLSPHFTLHSCNPFNKQSMTPMRHVIYHVIRIYHVILRSPISLRSRNSNGLTAFVLNFSLSLNFKLNWQPLRNLKSKLLYRYGYRYR